jgi:phospholipase/carboxylesterase
VTTRSLSIPFAGQTLCRVSPPAESEPGVSPPLLVALHGYAQTGARQQRWMEAAVPPHFAVAWPDAFHPFEVRKAGRPPRIGYAWYHYSADRPAFLASLAASDEAFWKLVDIVSTELGSDPERLWLAGFSQGAYLTNVLGLSHPERVAGWIAQAGNVRADYVEHGLPDLSGKPLLLQYGREDEALPDGAAEACRKLFADQGADATLSLHDAGHRIVPSMVTEVREWLEAHEAPR